MAEYPAHVGFMSHEGYTMVSTFPPAVDDESPPAVWPTKSPPPSPPRFPASPLPLPPLDSVPSWELASAVSAVPTGEEVPTGGNVSVEEDLAGQPPKKKRKIASAKPKKGKRKMKEESDEDMGFVEGDEDDEGEEKENDSPPAVSSHPSRVRKAVVRPGMVDTVRNVAA